MASAKSKKAKDADAAPRAPDEVGQQNLQTANRHREGFSDLAAVSREYKSEPFQRVLDTAFEQSGARAAAVAPFQREVERLEAKLGAATERITASESEIATLRAALRQGVDDLARAASAAYEGASEVADLTAALRQGRDDMARAASAAHLHHLALRQARSDLARAVSAAQFHHRELESAIDQTTRIRRAVNRWTYVSLAVCVILVSAFSYSLGLVRRATGELLWYVYSEETRTKSAPTPSLPTSNLAPKSHEVPR